MSKKKADQKDLDIITKQGIVTKVFNKQLELLVEGDSIHCMIPAAYMMDKNSVGVGDQVEVSISGTKQMKLTKVLDRTTAVYRGNRKSVGEDILIAANVDQMMIVVSADYLINQTGYVEEAAIAANRAEIGCSLYVSKWDMVNEQVQELIQKRIKLYESITNHIYLGSYQTLDDNLIEELSDKTTVFVGDRGCGKTSLIRTICSTIDSIERTGKILSTNAVELISCDDMKFIDTPGFRDFALQKIENDELELVFEEIAEQEDNCEYSNCTHTHEENCGVLNALRNKQISRERYQAYQKMRGTITTKVETIDYRHNACNESFVCKSCGRLIVPQGAGTQHRNHCPYCLCSIHVDNEPGDRASLCHGIMAPIGVWVRNDGEWAIIHRCKTCGALSSNRIAADDSPMLLMSIAVKPLSKPPFPLDKLEMRN